MYDDVFFVYVLYFNFIFGILLKRKILYNLFVIIFVFLNIWSYKNLVKEV